ncbi:MAG: hypothetical protein PVI91_05920 [Gammaproteobacteria bacterium]
MSARQLSLLSIELLKLAMMSSLDGSKSAPAIVFAKATWYQVPACGAFGKSRTTDAAPAEPSTAELALQDRGLKLA